VIYPELEAAGVPIARLPFVRGYGDPLNDVRALRGLAALLRRERFDLVHLHSAKAGVLGRLAARTAAIPAVYSPHCFPFVGPWGFPRKQLSVGVERALGPQSRAIICVAEEERRQALDLRIASADRLEVVHNGTGACPSGVEPDPQFAAFAAEGPLVAAIAVLRPQKAVRVFVDAAPAVLQAYPDARLAVVGNGEQRAELELRARELGLDGRFRFFDFSPPTARFLGSVEVFVLSSAWEAFPISVLEAMACGVPQVATAVGGTPEAVEDGQTGLLCPPGRSDLLAERILTLLRDPELRRRMARASRARHARHFLGDQMVERTAAVYGRALAGA